MIGTLRNTSPRSRRLTIYTDASIKTATEKPKFNIDSVNSFEFENLGTTVEVIANGTTTFANKTLNLKQFHFHSPSDHRIDEEYFPLEMHMVHEAAGKWHNSFSYAALANHACNQSDSV